MDGYQVSDSFESEIIWQDGTDAFEPSARSRDEFLGTVDPVTTEDGDSLAFIDSNARNQLERESRLDTSREHGGILLGEAFRDDMKGYYVVIREVVAAAETEGSAVHLQFQSESWQPVWRRLEERPDLMVVGWYHTHPGLGVFLSGTDMKTQRLYFSRPWQLAIVLDPIRNQIGYFLGKDGARCLATVFRAKQQTTDGGQSS